jgi:YHS domain-containing protein
MTKLLLFAAFGFILAGCAAPAGSDAAPSAAPQAGQPASGTPAAFRDAEGQLKCPVMGTPVASEKEASGFSDHDGKRYYFCCGDCKPKFDADPHQYVKH